MSSEAKIRKACEAGDVAAATKIAIDEYGREILSYLIACAPSRAIADDAFAELAYNVWRNLARFEWRASCRTWLYTLARNGLARNLRRERVHLENRANLSELPEVELAVDKLTRAPYQRTTMQEELARIRRQLPGEDRELLILRVDRGLSWDEIAAITFPELEGDEAELRRGAARLRKRFTRLKERLRALFDKLQAP